LGEKVQNGKEENDDEGDDQHEPAKGARTRMLSSATSIDAPCFASQKERTSHGRDRDQNRHAGTSAGRESKKPST